MPYAGFMKFLLAVGILSLLHAAYSAAQREYILSVYVFLSNWKKKSMISCFRSIIFARHRSRENHHIPTIRREYAERNVIKWSKFFVNINTKYHHMIVTS